MNKREYEILYIINPTLDESGKTDLVERFDTILTSGGAEISESKDWQKRRFAYEIEGYNEGVYHVIYFSVDAEDGDVIDEFDRVARINNGILRHLVVRRDDKEA